MDVGNAITSGLVFDIDVRKKDKRTGVERTIFKQTINFTGNLKKVLTEDAERLAEAINKTEGKETNTSKLRQYYQTVIKLRDRLKTSEKNEGVWNEFYMLKAKAQYDFTRKVINDVFKKFIFEAVDKIETREDFERFALFFEAVVGFFPKNTSQ